MVSKQKYKSSVTKTEPVFNNIFSGKYTNLIFIVLLFLILAISFFKIAFQHYEPPASDSIQWRTSAEPLIEYNKTHKDQALWNPNIFSGMPAYLISLKAKYPYFDSLRKLTDKVMNWRIFYLFLAAVGVYLLMLMLGFEPFIAFISAIAFSFSCHFIGLMEIGHNTKYRAVMLIPWIYLSIVYLRKHTDLLGLGMTSVFLIIQLKENHPQISYYTFLLIGIYWIFQLIWAIKEKRIGNFFLFSVLMLFSFIIVFMAVSQQYLLDYEYGKFSIRGAAGLEKGYAQSWSFHPLEILTFWNPGFFGGTSPYYWGWMPFTQTSMYMGIIVFILMIFGIFNFKVKTVKILFTVSLVAMFMSFGRHFPLLSDLLLKYLPGFNKFRVPAMILVLFQFCGVILAGFGLKFIIEKFKAKDEKFVSLMQKLLLVSVVFFLAFMLFSSVFGKMNLIHSGDLQKYKSSQIATLHSERLKILVSDGIHSFIFMILFFGTAYLFLKRKVGKYLFLSLTAVFIIADLLMIDVRFLKSFEPKKTIERSLHKTQIDRYLLQDKEIFRIYPLGGEFGQNKWVMYHQSIGGYHGAKIKRYQEIIANCLNAELKKGVPINWNVVNMLNAKYLIFNQQLPFDNLEYKYYDRNQKLVVYKNKDYLPRAWFVKNLELIKNKEKIWQRLNSPDFNPAETAIVENKIIDVAAPRKSSAKLLDFQLQTLKFEVETDTTSFLTVSEIYYPAGWKAFIDGKETEIYPVNYILRGVVIPKGKHILEMKFQPKTYFFTLKISLIGILLSLVALLLGLYFHYRKNHQGKIEYVVKE